MRRNGGAAERDRLIAGYRSSGLSVRAFCERERVSGSTMYGWLAGGQRSGAAGVRLARVIRTPSAPSPREAQGPCSPIVMQVGAIQVAVTTGFDLRSLGDVLDVVTARAGGRA